MTRRQELIEAIIDGMALTHDADLTALAEAALDEIEASGYAIVPREPTGKMHEAAREWSCKKYGTPIGIASGKPAREQKHRQPYADDDQGESGVAGPSVHAPFMRDDTVVLHLTGERRLLLRQELDHAVHQLEAAARQASPRGNRQRALCRRAEHLRAVADQLA